ncbi:DUF4231 domain-containing protein [Deinococcus sp. Leaf326]|uniref:DUF4231 domain-containing protein n=1 Tax=Deinococcus sp. Leaf326 TaxID=1736338 RepID=UPI0009E893D1|nr:DUF4231 domain-containing protein [Deinococcus sp. Leaf326]
MEIEDSDLPGLFVAADRLSKSSQNTYILMTRISLVLLIGIAVLGVFSFEDENSKLNIAFASGIAIAISIIINLILLSNKPDKDWYDGRAVAESVKTKSWRFMMRSDPYIQDDAEILFDEVLRRIRDERPSFVSKLDANTASSNQVTPKMQHVRSLSFNERKTIYLNKRIEDQRRWYATKSDFNKSKAKMWSNINLISQIVILLLCFAVVRWSNIPISIIGVLTTLVSCIVAWVQLKKYQELSNSYGLAAQELASIFGQGTRITQEDQFGIFVSDAENAISREHTMWSARRDAI